MHTLRCIKVKKLFGRYDYQLPADAELLDDVNILYGQNGAGKTTVLGLVFRLLSSSQKSGHRTRISEIPFQQLEVTLQDGTKLSATKDPQLLVGPVDFEIATPNTGTVSWRFIPGQTSPIDVENLPAALNVAKLPAEMREHVIRALEEKRYFDELVRLNIKVFMLTSDRMLLGDSSKEVTRVDQRLDGSRARPKLADLVLEHRVNAVQDALESASAWVRTKFFDRTYGANESSTNFYLDVVKKIAKSSYRTRTGLNQAQQAKTVAGLEQSIREIERLSKEFQRFGLGLASVSSELLGIIQGVSGNRLQLLSTILEPHLASLIARYEVLRPPYLLVNTFVDTLNKFFRDKRITYSVRHGFQVVVPNADEKLEQIAPSQLSSGEQQLLLLFCHVLTTRDSPNIFIIDEPELSLNILWQRMLVTSMLEVAKGSELQLILASHSMEILAKHRNRVVSMLDN